MVLEVKAQNRLDLRLQISTKTALFRATIFSRLKNTCSTSFRMYYTIHIILQKLSYVITTKYNNLKY